MHPPRRLRARATSHNRWRNATRRAVGGSASRELCGRLAGRGAQGSRPGRHPQLIERTGRPCPPRLWAHPVSDPVSDTPSASSCGPQSGRTRLQRPSSAGQVSSGSSRRSRTNRDRGSTACAAVEARRRSTPEAAALTKTPRASNAHRRGGRTTSAVGTGRARAHAARSGVSCSTCCAALESPRRACVPPARAGPRSASPLPLSVHAAHACLRASTAS